MGPAGLAVFLVLLYFLPSSQALVFCHSVRSADDFRCCLWTYHESMYSMCGTDSEYRTGKDTKGIIMAMFIACD